MWGVRFVAPKNHQSPPVPECRLLLVRETATLAPVGENYGPAWTL